MSEVPTKFSDICQQIKPKAEEHPTIQEKITIVPKGPEMTPNMRNLIKAALCDLVVTHIGRVDMKSLIAIKTAIEDTTHFIETLYLGTNKAMLKNYEQAAELAKAGNLIETSED